MFFFFCHYYYSANSTLLSLLRFSYFITPYDAQASSAFSAFILFWTGLEGVQLITVGKPGREIMYFTQYKNIVRMFSYCEKYWYVRILGD